MALVHDDDLARLDRIYNSTVSRSFIQYAIVLMFSHFQPLDGLRSYTVLGHIRSLKPAIHNARIGELFQHCDLSFTHSEGAQPKDMPSSHNSASAVTESSWVATLSNIFDKRREFLHVKTPLPQEHSRPQERSRRHSGYPLPTLPAASFLEL